MPVVEIHSLAGGLWKLEVGGQESVEWLKRQLAERLGKPYIHLKLLAGHEVLRDEEVLAAYAITGPDPVAITALVTHEESLRALRSREPERQINVLQALQAVGQEAGRDVVAAVTSVMKDRTESVEVRHAAITALPHISPLGDKALIKDLLRGFSDGRSTRLKAIEAAGVLGDRGERMLLPEIISQLDSRSGCIRCAAVLAIGRVAHGSEECRQTAISALSGVLGFDEDIRVRTAAVKAFRKVAQRSDHVSGVVATATTDLSLEVRMAALKALPDVAEAGEESAVSAAVNCLYDENAQIRCHALAALSVLARGGAMDILPAVDRLLEDADPNVQSLAMKLVAKLTAARSDGAKSSKSRRRHRGLRGRGRARTEGEAPPPGPAGEPASSSRA